jgi:putative tryptophan/tyrosine transport system substrate-binding protein
MADGSAHTGMPAIAYLNGASAAQFPHLLAGFRNGLSKSGYTEGRNLTIEYRYSDGRYDQLPTLAHQPVIARFEGRAALDHA